MPIKRSVYAWCEKEIIETVIAPKIAEALSNRFSSKTELLTYLNKKYDANISPTQLNTWLDHLGVVAEKTTLFRLAASEDTPHPPSSEVVEEEKQVEVTEGLPPRMRPVPKVGGIVEQRVRR
jgi:hypothetical protein